MSKRMHENGFLKQYGVSLYGDRSFLTINVFNLYDVGKIRTKRLFLGFTRSFVTKKDDKYIELDVSLLLKDLKGEEKEISVEDKEVEMVKIASIECNPIYLVLV